MPEVAEEHGRFVRDAWYLVAWSTELAARPLQRRVCGEDLVLFRTPDGSPHALPAICPHRGANLAKGKVVDGTLQCPFHGWRFDAMGRCVRIPSQPEHVKIPPGATLESYPLVEHQGCIWIWPRRGGRPFEPAPRYTIFDEPRALIRLKTRTIDAPFASVVENALDESHIYFLHQRTLGLHSPLSPRHSAARDADGRGITACWDSDTPWGREHFENYATRPGLLGWLADLYYGRFDWQQRTWSFRLGGVVLFREVFRRNGGIVHVLSAAMPIDASRTAFASAMSHPVLGSFAPKGLVERIGAALVDEDRLGTEALLRHSDVFSHPVSVVGDRATLAFRQLYADALQREGSLPGPSAEASSRLAG